MSVNRKATVPWGRSRMRRSIRARFIAHELAMAERGGSSPIHDLLGDISPF